MRLEGKDVFNENEKDRILAGRKGTLLEEIVGKESFKEADDLRIVFK